MVGRKVIVAALTCVAFVMVITHVFLRSFIEQGEERFWLFLYLIFVPIIAAGLVFYFLSATKFSNRMAVVLVVVSGLVLLIYQVPRLADLIGVGKVGQNIYSYVVRAESAYLNLFSYEQHYHLLHKKNLLNAGLAKALKSCNKDEILPAIENIMTSKDSLNREFAENVVNSFIASNRCPESLRALVRTKSEELQGKGINK